MFEGITVVDVEAVEKFIVDNSVPMSDILVIFRRELLAAGLVPDIHLSLYNFSDCDHCPSWKLYLECKVPEELDVDYVLQTEDDVVVSCFMEIKCFDHVVISLN